MTRPLIALAMAALIPAAAQAAHCPPGGFYRPSLGICEWHGRPAHHAQMQHSHVADRPRIIVRTRVVVRTRTVVRTVVIHDKAPAAAATASPIAWANLARPSFKGAAQ